MFRALLIAVAICNGPPASAFAPFHDGFYAIHVECEQTGPTCDLAQVRTLDGLSIVDTLVGGQLAVSLVSRQYKFVGFTTYGASGDGARISAASSDGSRRPRLIQLQVDARSGGVQGTLDDASALGRYVIRGQPISWLGSLSAQAAPPERIGVDALLGGYRSRIGGIGGTLIVKRLAERLVGSFMSDALIDGVPDVRVTYNQGAWDPQLGLLRLSSVQETEDSTLTGELALSFRARTAQGRPILSGFGWMGPAINPATAEKTTDLPAGSSADGPAT